MNCGFETGDFTGWVPVDMAMPFSPLAVHGTNFTSFSGLFLSRPTELVHAATTGFDGAGPDAVHLAQDVTLPPGARTLTFDYRVGWDLVSFCSGCTGSRRFDVTVQPSGGGSPLATLPIRQLDPGTMNADTGPLVGTLDVSAYAGTAVRVAFDWTVPDTFTGPAFVQVDDVAVAGCGDGVLQAGEECDDGNVSPGDGCDATCHVERCFVCAGAPSTCTVGLGGCRRSSLPKKSQLMLVDKSSDKKDRFVWKWRKGDATALADFGDPTTSEDYLLCVADTSGAASRLAMRVTIPPGGTCGKKACWTAKGSKGFFYRNHDRTAGGLLSVQLKPGAAGKATIALVGSGENLSLPSLPLGVPGTVQLQAGTGQCWETTFGQAGVKKNTSTLFKGNGTTP